MQRKSLLFTVTREVKYFLIVIIKDQNYFMFVNLWKESTVELLWLEHFRDYENLFETGVIRAIDWELIIEPGKKAWYGHLFDFLQHKSMLCVFIRIASSRYLDKGSRNTPAIL